MEGVACLACVRVLNFWPLPDSTAGGTAGRPPGVPGVRPTGLQDRCPRGPNHETSQAQLSPAFLSSRPSPRLPISSFFLIPPFFAPLLSFPVPIRHFPVVASTGERTGASFERLLRSLSRNVAALCSSLPTLVSRSPLLSILRLPVEFPDLDFSLSTLLHLRTFYADSRVAIPYQACQHPAATT